MTLHNEIRAAPSHPNFFLFVNPFLGSLLFFFNLCDLLMSILIDQSQYDFIYTLIDLLDQVCYNPKSGAECSAFPQPEDGRPDNPNGPLGTASVFDVHRGPG